MSHALLIHQFTLAASPPREGGTPPIVILIVVLLILGMAFLFLWQARAKAARRQQQAVSPREQIEAIKQRAGADDSGRAVIAELHDTARRLASQIDAKAERLEILLEQADDRLRRLDAALSANDDAVTPRASDSPADEPEPVDPRSARIHMLADRGLSAIEIARELDEQTGAVELTLALRRSRSQGG